MPAPGEGDEAVALTAVTNESPKESVQLHDWLAEPGAAALVGEEARVADTPVLLGLSLMAAVFWTLGVTLPIVVIRPLPFGDMEPIYKSTLGTLQLLWEDGHLLALLILTVCSVVLPISKAITTTVAILTFRQLHLPDAARTWLDGSISVLAALSSYQCVDLLLGILFVAFLPDNGFISASIQWGFLFFAAYCVVSQALLLLLQKMAAAGRAAPPETLGGAPAEAGRTGRGASGSGLLEAGRVEAAVLGGLLLLLGLLASVRPLLEVSITYEGFCLERSRLGLLGVAAALADEGGPFLGCLLMSAFLLSVAVAPLAVAGLALLGAVLDAAAPSPEGEAGPGQRWLRISREVAHWALPDVFALALVTFVFTMQDSQVVTTVPEGWFSSFHWALGLGAVGFALKWTTVRPCAPEPDEEQALHAEGGDKAARPKREALSLSAPAGLLSRYELRLTAAGCPARAGLRRALLAAPWLVWALGCAWVRGPPALPGMAGTDEILQRAAELGNRALATQMPRSIGDCRRAAGAPEPCRPDGNGSLAEVTDDTYDLDTMIRWAAGVDTVRVTSARALRSSDAERPVQIVLDGVIENLTLSMRIQKCFLNQCNVLFDNTDGCCEPNRKVRVSVAAACRDGARGAELEPFSLQELALDKVNLKETLFGFIRMNVADLSGRISSRLEVIVQEFLSGKRRVLGLTVNEIVAGLWRHNVAGAGTCAELVGSL